MAASMLQRYSQRALLPFILIAGLFLSSCGQDEWEGYVYPNKNNLTIHISLGAFDTLDECREYAYQTMASLTRPKMATFECGLNCETDASLGGIRVCEKTTE